MNPNMSRIAAGFALVALTAAVDLAAQREDPLNPDWATFHSTADAYALLEA